MSRIVRAIFSSAKTAQIIFRYIYQIQIRIKNILFLSIAPLIHFLICAPIYGMIMFKINEINIIAHHIGSQFCSTPENQKSINNIICTLLHTSRLLPEFLSMQAAPIDSIADMGRLVKCESVDLYTQSAFLVTHIIHLWLRALWI